jgi:hypothetical protein
MHPLNLHPEGMDPLNLHRHRLEGMHPLNLHPEGMDPLNLRPDRNLCLAKQSVKKSLKRLSAAHPKI